MSNDPHIKSCSHTQLPERKMAGIKREHIKLMFCLSPEGPRNSNVHEKTNKQAVGECVNNQSQLQIFKNRFLEGLKKRQEGLAAEGCKPESVKKRMKVNKYVSSGSNTPVKHQFSSFSPCRAKNSKKEMKTVHNFFFNSKKKTSCVVSEREEDLFLDGSVQFDDQQFRKSRSIIMIHKLHRKKESLAQHQREKYEQQFYKTKGVPIHHTQFYFSRHHKAKTEQSTPKQSKGSQQRTNRVIQDILRLQQALKKEQQRLKEEADEQNSPQFIRNQIKVQQIEACRQNKIEHFRLQRKRVSFERSFKSKRKSQVKEAELEFGPWKRSVSGDYQGFF